VEVEHDVNVVVPVPVQPGLDVVEVGVVVGVGLGLDRSPGHQEADGVPPPIAHAFLELEPRLRQVLVVLGAALAGGLDVHTPQDDDPATVVDDVPGVGRLD
jgi:hypothetical protein